MPGKPKIPTLDLSFMEPLTGPFSNLDGFVTFSLKELGELDPEGAMKRLVDRAKLQKRKPAEFYREICLLVTLQRQIDEAEQDVETYDLLFTGLKKRYDIKDMTKRTGPDTITMIRLYTMFPHFGFVDCYCKLLPRFSFSSSSSAFELTSNRAFAGLIPDPNGGKLFIDDETQADLTFIHLYGRAKLPLYSHKDNFQYIKWRVEKSLLSNERRVKFLENLGVLTASGALSETIQTAIKEIEFWRTSTAFQTYSTLLTAWIGDQ